MADNVSITAGSGTTVATDERNSAHEQLVVAGSHRLRLQLTPVINTAAYATGDVLGTLMTLTSAARYTGGGGYVRSINILSKAQAQSPAIDVLFFDRSVTVAANNAPVTMSDADMAFCLGVISLLTTDYATAWPGTPLNSFATKLVEFPYVCAATDLFALLVVRGTPTYTSTSDIVATFTFEQN